MSKDEFAIYQKIFMKNGNSKHGKRKRNGIRKCKTIIGFRID